MAKPIQDVTRHEPTEAELQAQALGELLSVVAKHGDAIKDLLKIVELLHEMGAMEVIGGLIQSREKVMEIGVSQLSKPTMTRGINNVMSAVGMVGELEPEMIRKVVSGVVNGIDRSNEELQSNQKMGMFDLIKVLRDPNANRALTMAVGFLKGLGEKL
ncbi:DUF1641 domain-containing protein [Aneurinibacillus uraniidurans]|uniref:DUF1641 domain-containing protein n=1 Tax=Aneurinibacillus uraniidurans TaxID=2966586 RepID=UPI00234954BE|nr:DUF1641 domain-containing protein [Aneurinibacillus sp. B1]WCN37602.1 DUF1641 domain-containing protein [Aneurinibacillus sp. B1]